MPRDRSRISLLAEIFTIPALYEMYEKNLHFPVAVDVGLHGESEHGVMVPLINHPGGYVHIEA